MTTESIVDRIYEAAFVPEMWGPTLEQISAGSGSAAGALLLFSSPVHPPQYKATPRNGGALRKHIESGAWKDCGSAAAMFAQPTCAPWREFAYMADFAGAEAVASERQTRLDAGLDEQISTLLPMITGEVIVYTFERGLGEGRHAKSEIVALNGLRPHLARASLMAARLGIERARDSVAIMEKLGLPAAVLTAKGRVLAANPLLERLPEAFIPRAHGILALATMEANALLQDAIAELASDADAAVQSIPLPATEEHSAMVVHVLPLRRAAHDIFSGGDIMIVATEVGLHSGALPPGVLMGLFDLTGAEAQLAGLLAAGSTLADAAASQGIKVTTARAYLAQIFRKTGTVQQSQLVALLRSTQPTPRISASSGR